MEKTYLSLLIEDSHTFCLRGLYFILFVFLLSKVVSVYDNSTVLTSAPSMLIISDQPQMPFPPSLAGGSCFFLCVCLVQGFIGFHNLSFISRISSYIPVFYVSVVLSHESLGHLSRDNSLMMLSILPSSSDISKGIVPKCLRSGLLSSNYCKSRGEDGYFVYARRLSSRTGWCVCLEERKANSACEGLGGKGLRRR